MKNPRRRFGYMALGPLLLISFACGTAGESADEASPETISVRGVTYGTALTPRQQIAREVSEFQPTDPVCVSVAIDGRPREGVVTLRWPVGAEVAEAEVDLANLNGGVFFSVGETTYVGGTLSHERPLRPGRYETLVLYEGEEIGRYPFQVAAPPASLSGPFTTPYDATPAPLPVDPFPATAQPLYGSWSHPSIPAGEHITLALVALDVADDIPPATTIGTAELDVAEAQPGGGPLHFAIDRPWPVGEYRIEARGSTLGEFATLSFSVR